ncbi:hypothetical protein PRIPAC_86356 [Pristionchus pacificus]|uniref:Lipase n=1 Tax=Pristionchus pacificus TaxID=54126 RepID=A0A2A6BRS2_PRIPA|nr:hypothetical protein PRIPAC_86356 [Pristionchus pacificus]|eukprot:PDM68600.1 hydrolase [Pristionchus pacificus]
MLLLLLLLVVPLWAARRKDEATMSPLELIRHRGYSAQEHHVTTKDGYILTLHRIPGDRKGCRGGRPVLLQHGLILSSRDFLAMRRNESLSYALADAGYDVWMANSRGNIYSMGHKKLNVSDERFWNFSGDELGRFDFPAIIDYVLKKSRRKRLFVVGHSQAALSLLIADTVLHSIRRKVIHFFGLAPAIGTQAAAVNLARIVGNLPPEMLAQLPSNPSSPVFFPFCADPKMTAVCTGILAAAGPMDQLDKTRVPQLLSHFPAGTSMKLMLHWLQQMNTNRTTAFDYGEEGNLKAYGKKTAPVYDFSRYRVPTSLYFSAADTIVDTASIKQAFAVLPECSIASIRNLTGFGHFDFLWGQRANKEVYSKIIKEMRRME